MASIQEEGTSAKANMRLRRAKCKFAFDRLKTALDLPSSVSEHDAVSQAAAYIEKDKENRKPLNNSRPKKNILPKPVRPTRPTVEAETQRLLDWCLENTVAVWETYLRDSCQLQQAKNGEVLRDVGVMDNRFQTQFADLEMQILLQDHELTDCSYVLALFAVCKRVKDEGISPAEVCWVLTQGNRDAEDALEALVASKRKRKNSE